MNNKLPNTYSTRHVPGDGPIPCDIMLIGEAPGEQEDKYGKPFMGAAGRILNQFLHDNSLLRKDVYITNAVKYRPPANRKPTIEEILSQRELLLAEIEVVRPKILVTLGKSAFEAMIGKPALENMEFYRSKRLFYKGILLIPTYHPAVLLRNSYYLEYMKDDFIKVKEIIDSGFKIYGGNNEDTYIQDIQ